MRLFLVGFAAWGLLAGEPAFEPNRGQGPQPALYLARDASGPILIEDAALQFGDVRLQRLRAARGNWEEQEPLGTNRYCHTGRSPELCATGVSTYRRLIRRGIYPGIDWVIYQNGGHLEYDLMVQPGADARLARFQISGHAATLDSQGSLHAGSLVQRAPQVRQGGQLVTSRVQRLGPDLFGFALGHLQPDEVTVIDPVIERARIDGGQGDDRTLGASGPFRFGTTRSSDWSGKRDSDVFVRIEQPGSGIVTIFWGGDGDEELSAFQELTAIQPGAIWLAGSTSSANAREVTNGIPNPAMGIARGLAGGMDGFVLEINAQRLATARIVGGPGDDRIHSMQFLEIPAYRPSTLILGGETTNPHWPGMTSSRTGPGGTGDASDTGNTDAFVATWNVADGSGRLLAIGGSGRDRCRGMQRFEGTNRWILAGETDSPDLPLTVDPRAALGVDLWAATVNLDESVFVPDPKFCVMVEQGKELAGT